MTNQQRKMFLELLWDYLKGDKQNKNRVITGWGTKTEKSLIACIERIIDEE